MSDINQSSSKTTSNNNQSVDETKTASQCFAELESIVNKFEQGDVDLEEAVALFSQGTKLAEDLRRRIKVVENQIEEIKTQFVDE